MSDLASTVGFGPCGLFRESPREAPQMGRAAFGRAILEESIFVRQRRRASGSAPDRQSQLLHRCKDCRFRICARSRPRVCRGCASQQRAGTAEFRSRHRHGRRNRSQAIRRGLEQGIFGGRRHSKEPVCDCLGLRGSRRSSRRSNHQLEPGIVARVECAITANLIASEPAQFVTKPTLPA